MVIHAYLSQHHGLAAFSFHAHNTPSNCYAEQRWSESS